MKAILMREPGTADVLYYGDAPRPVAGPGEVLIRVHATSVNRPDIVQREGNYPPPPGESDILGLEVAGVVEAVAPDVRDWRPGDRVMTLVGGGGYAEYARARADLLMRIPEGMDFETAACVCETYITAYLNVFMVGGLRDGDTALLHGGGGGVNTAALLLCRALAPRARLIVTASPGKEDRLKVLGAHHVIDYRATPDFAAEVKTITNKKGADVILDHIGARYLAPNMNSLAAGGRLVIIGVMSGIKAELNLALMMVKRQQIIGSVLRSRPAPEKAAIVREFSERALPGIADGRATPIVEKVFPLAQAAQAHAWMEAGGIFGKIVLSVRPT
ncbi:NADPH:quinone oxidoreductase [Bordetella sp. H567]|nr:NADPH:quinone oxidoreductase [Bordetella sp. H567]